MKYLIELSPKILQTNTDFLTLTATLPIEMVSVGDNFLDSVLITAKNFA